MKSQNLEFQARTKLEVGDGRRIRLWYTYVIRWVASLVPLCNTIIYLLIKKKKVVAYLYKKKRISF